MSARTWMPCSDRGAGPRHNSGWFAVAEVCGAVCYHGTASPILTDCEEGELRISCAYNGASTSYMPSRPQLCPGQNVRTRVHCPHSLVTSHLPVSDLPLAAGPTPKATSRVGSSPHLPLTFPSPSSGCGSGTTGQCPHVHHNVMSVLVVSSVVGRVSHSMSPSGTQTSPSTVCHWEASLLSREAGGLLLHDCTLFHGRPSS